MRSRIARKTLPGAEYLRECFAYDPDIGVLMWKDRPLSHFTDDTVYLQSNSRTAGRIAGSPYGDPEHLNANVKIDGVCYAVTRVIYKLVTGKEPDSYLHADGCNWPYIPFNKIKKI